MEIFTNIVKQDKLQKQSLATLKIISESLSTSFGPYGSATQIKKENALPKFTKDGHTILKNLSFNGIIEYSLREVLEDLTSHIVKEVGDGTTSAIILSDLIYSRLATKVEPNNLESEYQLNYPPADIEYALRKVVKDIEEEILASAKEIKTYEDIKKIALISTNNNEDLANIISDIYMQYGLEVFIDVKRSNDSNDYVKVFDGMTINSGYTNKEFVTNDAESTAEVNSPQIYFFEDPIDTPEMIEMFGAIVFKNIFEKIKAKEQCVPTVVVCPKMSKDAATIMDPLIQTMVNAKQSKFNIPFLLIADAHQPEIIMDLVNLTGAKTIRKYINLDQQVKDQENGDAPTVDTVHEWYGTADAVIAGYNKTKFINPKLMYNEGTTEFSEYYKAILNNVHQQLLQAKQDGKDLNDIGNLKRRLHSLKANMVDLFIGGATPEERENRYDSAEDAVLNCMSAAEYGYGVAANVQGLHAIYDIAIKKAEEYSDLENAIVDVLAESYRDLVSKLYSTVTGELVEHYCELPAQYMEYIDIAVEKGIPLNLRTGKLDSDVVTSIRSDVVILGIVSKVIGMLVTTKQFLCESPVHNIYVD